MLSNETKIDWQFLCDEELLNELLIELEKLSKEFWDKFCIENFSNNAGLHSQTNISNPSLLDCQDAVQEYMYKLIEKIKNEKDYSISFSLVEHGIENLIIDEIRRRDPKGNRKSERLKEIREFEKLSPHEQKEMKDKLAIENPNVFKKVCEPEFIKKIEDSFFEEQNFDYNEIHPRYFRRMHELIDPEEKVYQNMLLTKLDDFLASGDIDDECLQIFKFLRAGLEPKDIIKELNINHNEKYRRKEKKMFQTI